ncbi:MAG: M48 family metallopeptidase [Halanaerobiales bacterium]
MDKINKLFDQKRRQIAVEYNKKRKIRSIIGFIITVIFWIVFLASALELDIYYFLHGLFNNSEVIILGYLLIFYLLYSIFQTVLDYFLVYRLNRHYNLSNQSTGEWLVDEVKSFVLGIIFLYLAVRSYLYLFNNYPDSWWIYYTILASIAVVIITFILPTVLLPIFFNLKSYPESDLKSRLMALIKEADIKIDDIYEINLSSKVNAANAAVMGIGSSRKVVLGDNLKNKYTDDEIEAVLAHEMGHQVHGDIFKNILMQPIMFLIISFIVYTYWPSITEWYGYSEAGAVYTIPLLLILVSFLSWLLTPIELYISRVFEKRADIYSIELTGSARPLASAMAKLADEGLSPLKASLYRRIFKQSHPPMKERVEYILEQE